MPCIVLGRLELGFVRVSPSVRGGGEGEYSVFYVLCYWLVGCAGLPGWRAAPMGGVALYCVNDT